MAIREEIPSRENGTLFGEDAHEDVCEMCGCHVGYGSPIFHLEICDDCEDTPEAWGDLLVERGSQLHTIALRLAGDRDAIDAAARRVDLDVALRALVASIEALLVPPDGAPAALAAIEPGVPACPDLDDHLPAIPPAHPKTSNAPDGSRGEGEVARAPTVEVSVPAEDSSDSPIDGTGRERSGREA